MIDRQPTQQRAEECKQYRQGEGRNTVRGSLARVGNGRRLEEPPRLLNLAAAALDGPQRREQLGFVRLRREGCVQQRAGALVEPAQVEVGKRGDQTRDGDA